MFLAQLKRNAKSTKCVYQVEQQFITLSTCSNKINCVRNDKNQRKNLKNYPINLQQLFAWLLVTDKLAALKF